MARQYASLKNALLRHNGRENTRILLENKLIFQALEREPIVSPRLGKNTGSNFQSLEKLGLKADG